MGVRAPEVAVVITCRNYAEFVGEAIESVARQTYSGWRCVVVDDASTDGSREVIEATLARLGDARLSMLALTENVGQLRALGCALAQTPGQFVALLDADDAWFPGFLEAHVCAHLNGAKSAPISGSDVLIVDGAGVAVEGTFSSVAKARGRNDPNRDFELVNAFSPTIDGDQILAGDPSPLHLSYMPRHKLSWHWSNTSAMVFRRDFIDIALPADGKPRERHVDYYLAYLAQMLGGTLILPDALGIYRLHGGNLFAKLPRIGGAQMTGVEPDGAIRHVHECIVLHVMRHWTVFEQLVGPFVLAAGLRHFIPWRELDALAARNGIAQDTRDAIARGLKHLRLEEKSGLERLAVKYLGL